MGGGGDDGEDKGPDTRMSWLSSRVCTSLKCKEEKFSKLIATDEAAAHIVAFLDAPDVTRLVIFDNGKGDLNASATPPAKFKKKSVFFIKLNKVPLTNENIGAEVIFGDFGEVPLEHLSLISQEVFLPLLCNPRNQTGWPEVISKEVTENLHNFIANVYVTIGQTKGKTLLPPPPTESRDGGQGMRDKDRIHVLETAVTTWTKQIKGVLKQDADQALKDGDNPGPLVELEFWTSKANNLNAIHEQLCGKKVRKVVKLLIYAKSTYVPSFNRLCRDVALARVEANDNVRFLKPLTKYFEKLATADEFPALVELFKPVMHIILLIWNKSQYYNTASRLVVLMREICNDLIMQACKYVEGRALFEMEPQEAVDKLKATLKICGMFKQYYFDYKAKTASDENPWRFQNSALFARLDSFLERCHDILDLSQTVLQFNKLERVEVGGTKGKTLTTSVRQIYADFDTAVQKFHTVQYDIMDVETKQFDDDFYEFRCVIKELERRLASVITQAFDDCTTVGTRFKLLDSFEGLLEREIIQADLEKKHVELIRAFGEDLKAVQIIFTQQKAMPPVNRNAPPHSGAINWVRGLRERIKEPMEKLRNLSKIVMETEEAKEVTKLFGQLSASLIEYERATVADWCRVVEASSEEKLKQNLLVRDDSSDLPLLSVNFDPALVRLLREVKYFLLLALEVPEQALKLYERGETLRQQTGKLELIVGIYNNILKTLLPVEAPLVEKKLNDVDDAFTRALSVLNWNSHKIDDYISELMSMVKDLNSVLNTVKGNVLKTRSLLEKWATAPLMFTRKDGKTYEVDEFRKEMKEHTSSRHNEIAEAATAIGQLLNSSHKTLKVAKGAPAWKAYVEYINDIVLDGFSNAIIASVSYLFSQIDNSTITANETAPLLEVSLELIAPEIVWVPEVGEGSAGDGVRDLFNSWIKAFLHTATLMKRLDIFDGNYAKEMEEDFRVRDCISQVQSVVLANEVLCQEFKASYLKYEYLWKKDLNDALHEFISSNVSAEAGEGSDPPLEKFEAEIEKYKAVQKEIASLESTLSIGWLRIDAKPLKQALSTWAKKWSHKYTHYLSNKVTDSMDELYTFIAHANTVLNKDPTAAGEGGGPDVLAGEAIQGEQRDVLYEVMGVNRDMRKREANTDAMFEPLKQTVQLLKGHGIILAEPVLKKLEEGPMAWNLIKKEREKTAEKLSTLQQGEQRQITNRSDAFGEKVEKFRKLFQELTAGLVKGTHIMIDDIDEAFETLDHFHQGEPDEKFKYGSVKSIMHESVELNESQELFELVVRDYVALRRCDEELVTLKLLWDMISHVLYTFADWNSTLFDKVDVDYLETEAKKLEKQLKDLDKAVRNFDTYKMLADQIKAMRATLPLITELSNPCMRERHWKSLMVTAQKTFVKDEKTTLGDLLSLELHTCPDAVAETVEKATKEQGIEKALDKIERTWAGLNLSFVPFPEQEVLNLVVDEIISETLENDALTLQNMGSNKYVQQNQKFSEIVSAWQSKLGTVQSVLEAWLQVATKWSMLESVFVGSADIKVQLPEDTKRFEGINADFQDLMKAAPEELNCVQACIIDGRLERLENMGALLEQCEKALQDYLETKRLAFPRFYFVAPADLLDILSKGTNPQLVLKHLAKCFDALDNLEFSKDDKGNPTKNAIGMYAGKPAEYIEFAQECLCDGPVETWLQTVVDTMRHALHEEYAAALPKYDDMPRVKWMFEQSAQNTITASRTVFTQEINEAFEQLEEGNDNALKDCKDKQDDQLKGLITVVNGELTSLQRKKVLTLCTIDVHARDLVQALIDKRIEAGTAFQWQSQLRYIQNEKTKRLQVNVCDAEIPYEYEYIGNCGCLVITPLTDRCYITLTQAQRLALGGAPAGPAGTGKTETVKDLARALGIQVYVFNCSDQMDYKAMGLIYKGLAQTGAWGCFDEFNRIPVAVLSVCSTQYKTVLDAIRANKKRFIFEDVEIGLRKSVMAFITMNPGYPGRAELPESLKALFRPVSMCVPDLQLICENMLMGEGFLDAKKLARKFVILYRLCEALLSAARHYDWKLRAIKTTLYVAGGMKRSQPHLTEDKVLLQALRDFNLGKLTSDDLSIFIGLLQDLFPKLLEQVPRNRSMEFEAEITKAAVQLKYQPEETFVLKITQLREIFTVRWSVFLLGPAGCAKSAVWKTLLLAQKNYGESGHAKPINPKSVSRNELYGFLNPQTREWKEGLMSVTFRNMNQDLTTQHQWIILDGDIDAEWIESMNTVMDDNKMLTLASNERIALTGSMRLLLEINHMNHCSPATVTRGGVIYLNQEDVGFGPAVDSWISEREAKQYRPLLMQMFGKYVAKSIEHCRRNFGTIVPILPINIAGSICKIMEGIIPSEEVRGAPAPNNKLLEYQFVFACVWALGGAMLVDKVVDYRTQFSAWWKTEWKDVFFPDTGLVFDYYVDEKNVMMVPWDDKVPGFGYSSRESFNNLFVPSIESTRLTYFMNNLMDNGHYVMFVGNAGTGKTALMKEKIKALDAESWTSCTINCNNFMDASALQVILEQPLDKQSGSRYGPPAGKRLVYLLDDFNMPYVDKYDTQSPIELARQYVDYGGWFDKVKIQMKEIQRSQLAACMNPTAGSFNITPRMQRHFVTFAVQMPTAEVLRSIFAALIEGHMQSYDQESAKLAPKLVDATVELHKLVANTFLPSAVKFHYQWNLRELSNVTQGICRTLADYYTNPVNVVRLWIHEVERVFQDRMVNETDVTKFAEMRETVTRKYFEDADPEAVEARPIIYNAFMTYTPDEVGVYTGVSGFKKLKDTLEQKLAEYNESNAVMNLVLFNQAMEHICRICRIIELPAGNAMLVGVGGSGKQSLAKLASSICGYDVFGISVTSTYGIKEFKEDLLGLYTKAGVKSTPVTFLMTDGQIINERFLVYLNDLLSSGYIPDLFTQEDRDNFNNSVRKEVKEDGTRQDTPENCWDFFINKVRRYLHVVLCFSPVGDKFRIRARNFPALINCTVIDWFQPWPHEALVSVAGRFLSEIPDIAEDVMENMQYHMAFVHLAVTDASAAFLEQDRRFNYTTPKSFLELISLYKNLLETKRNQLKEAKLRLESGVEKIAQASAQVADLQVNLKQEQVIVEEKNKATDALLASIGDEKVNVDKEVEAGAEDEAACAKIAEEVANFQDECAEDLKAAEPIILEAEAALNSLDKKSLGELKSFGSPADIVVQVVAACMVLCAPGGKIPKDLSWNAGKKSMGNVDQFLKSLIDFDKDNTPENCVEKVEKEYITIADFKPEIVVTKSGAAAGLCAWVINICKYFRIYQVVAPKRAALADANKKLDNANKKLSGIRGKVKELRDRVAALEANLMKATEDKNAAVAQAEKTKAKANLADRLVNGLAGENKRWSETIEKFGVAEGKLVGDVLLAAAFVSYAGPFTTKFRNQLTSEKWAPDLKEREIPMTEGIMPLDVLCDDALRAQWGNEGLPTDPLSIENGAIVENATRWPLMIDPQLQGISWIKNKTFGTDPSSPTELVIVQLSMDRYLDKVVHCIEQGLPLVIENLQEDIDAVLDPVVSRSTMTRGRNRFMKIGDKEVEYDANFKLFLQTKLSNPHYKPEIAAQTTLLNFCVTEKGLEDQLLALVVEKERPDLQEEAQSLVRQLGEYTITLKGLEDNLLFRLANSQGDILEDIELIENLEETKRTATEIAEKVALANETQKSISAARELYRPVATRGALLYFLIDNLNVLDRCYQYSMANFVYIMRKGMDLTPGGATEDLVPVEQRLGEQVPVEKRVSLLIDFVSLIVFRYIASGLFEKHKLIVASQLCMAILKGRGQLNANLFDWLLRGPKVTGVDNPLSEWVTESVWASVQSLKELDGYSALPDDLVGSAKRWREWMECERPEEEQMPGDWKKMEPFEQLLLFRALRPDRMSNKLSMFVENIIGTEYITSVPFDLPKSFADCSPGTPCFIYLSPGVDVAAAVEAMGAKEGFTFESGRYASVSLGQGQETIAYNKLKQFHKNGGWVLLQNIHLTIDWTNGELEKVVDKLAEGAHQDFRLFLSAEPPPILEKGLAISLLQNSVKLTNEPPAGMKANLLRAYGNFTEEMFESCAKQAEFKSIVFALCYFHAAILERKKFGVGNMPGALSGIGWNMNYPFNTGDLLCCGNVVNNYLENNSKVPWDDLKYIIGEIMYGGHVVEDWDRRLSEMYLESYLKEDLLEGNFEFFKGFVSPPNTLNKKQTLEFVNKTFEKESPLAFGLHQNAEIGFKLREAESLCSSLLSLQPREAGGEGGVSTEDKAKTVLDDVLRDMPEQFDMEEIRSRIDELSPYVMVAIQESERMNVLLAEMKRSLAELDLGLKGDLTMSDPMEILMNALANDGIAPLWMVKGWATLRPLGSWLINLQQRCTQLSDWTADLSLPKVVWISGLFNPQSFLTAVMQTTARRNEWALDKTVTLTDVTKKSLDQVEGPSREGAFIHGLTLEGARWDDKASVLEDCRPKEMFCPLPVILIKAVTADKAESKDAYMTPVYKTERRFREEVFTAQLKSKHGTIRWTLTGCCCFLDVVV
mmetsp:Transcript_25005/g.85566  ORF Transcript_25005/g.85566 Transcript_25005/m.85566 type:complete len:4525 (+) Transcript_25005:136-13710(+)|eukprot:CAMPEP_0183796752 /NCGR_PEP_ID=MMETSP0803_2-20130417/12631_1 /TAXON_ID=195967 /ORGANISM="Crustomastix stigmata, Strain CCMP3273" /LENGTH=4524 /DNA_ID=CAMNT_0026041409 /DNA_START=96 /DNA_END=13670 /DNA_ORIENTATION=-